MATCGAIECLEVAAPYYNLALVVVVFILFIRLFKRSKIHYHSNPWKLLFVGFLIFIIEEIFTVLRNAGVLPDTIRMYNPVFEMVILSVFIYAVLLQRQYVKEHEMLKTETRITDPGGDTDNPSAKTKDDAATPTQ